MRTLGCSHVEADEACIYAGCELFLDVGKFEMEVCHACLPSMMDRIDEYLGKASPERGSMMWKSDPSGILRGVYYAPVHRQAHYLEKKRNDAYALVQEELVRANISILHIDCADDPEDRQYCAFERGGQEIPDAESAKSLLDAVSAVLQQAPKS